MKELTDSLVSWWREKTNGPLYFTYLTFLAGWNWRSIYILFFDSSESYSLPRLEYFNSFVALHGLGPWFDPVLNATWALVPPTLLTFLAVRYLPYVNAWAHDWHLKHYFRRKEAWDKASIDYERKQAGFYQQRTRATKAKRAAKTELDRVLTPEEKWDDEFANLDQSGVDALQTLFRIIYNTSGSYSAIPNSVSVVNRRSTYVSSQALARIDGLGVANINFTSGNMSLTDKGKLFIRRLQEKGLA